MEGLHKQVHVRERCRCRLLETPWSPQATPSYLNHYDGPGHCAMRLLAQTAHKDGDTTTYSR